MRSPASEKLEIIRTVEASHLPVKRTLAMLGIPSSTYYQWYARWVEGGIDGLADRSPRPSSVWNRIPDGVREDLVEFALDHEDLTPRELAVKYTDEKRYFVSESSAYRILKSEDLITAPAHVVIRAADEFRDKTTRPNELWQTDFTYLKVIGWGWFYLSTILDDYSRYIVAWKLCTTVKAGDVTDTLELALEASGCAHATVVQKPRLLSDNGSSYVAADLAGYLEDKRMDHVRGTPHHPQRGLQDGDAIRVYNDIGEIRTHVHVTEGIVPGVIAISYHVGREHSGRYGSGSMSPIPTVADDDPDFKNKCWDKHGVHPNTLIRNSPDVIGGQQRWMDTVVRVEKA